MAKENDLEKVTKIMGEPVIQDFTDNTMRIRRNLLIFCGITLFYKLNHLSITKSAFLGLEFGNLTDDVITKGLFFLVLYHFLHFVLNIAEHIFYLRLHITGMKVRHVTVGRSASSSGDYPDDPKQSTLYNWWQESARTLTEKSKIYKGIEDIQSKQDDILKLCENEPQNAKNEIIHIKNHITGLSHKLEAIDKVLSDKRIEVSLDRFDKWFRYYQWQQIFRWVTMELGIPIVAGGYSLYLTCPFSLFEN